MFDEIDLFAFLPKKVQTGCLIVMLMLTIAVVAYVLITDGFARG
ncbi:MAG: hypothetical protein QNJ15_05635 [Erythrobacter sp.]|nr:hypothetical protein [Erythrobacter sp.]